MTNLLHITRKHDITFCRNGRIHISARVAKLLGLGVGDAINIAHTGDGEYLLYIQLKAGCYIGGRVATCYPSKHGGRHFRANSKALCDALLDAAGVAPQRLSASFYAGEAITISDTLYIPIITKVVL